MFEEFRDSVIQRGVDEALACQDMLARAPVKSSLLARLQTRLKTNLAIVLRRSPRTATRPTVSFEPTR